VAEVAAQGAADTPAGVDIPVEEDIRGVEAVEGMEAGEAVKVARVMISGRRCSNCCVLQKKSYSQ